MISSSWFVNAIPNIGQNIVAMCDVNDRKAELLFKAIPQAKKFHDLRKMLEQMNKDMDAVVIATPDHTQAVAAAATMRAGKGVFCEKPLTHNIREARTLRELAAILWVGKYVLKKPLFETSQRDRWAMVIAVGGSKSKKQFDNIQLTMKAYFDVLDFKYFANLFVNKVDALGAIKKHPLALNEAYRLGKELISVNTYVPQKPIDVELT